jgi:LEA14-like dessication related protein
MHVKRNLLLGITGCLFFFGVSCKKPEAPEYLGFQNIQVSKMDMQQSIISADVKFYNPNAFPMQLKKAEMDIFINEKPANHYVLDSTINIPAKDSFWVPVKLNLNINNLFSNALQSLMNDQLLIRLEGHVKVKKGGFSFRVPVRYEEKQKLSELMKTTTGP